MVERGAALYLPMVAAVIGYAVSRGRPARTSPRTFAACLLSVVWCVPALLLLQRANLAANWWSFPGPDGLRMLGMPLELWCGWAVLWSVTSVFVLGRHNVFASVMFLTAFDLTVMPLCPATLHLHRYWIAGEGVAVLLVLLPSLCLQRWTLRGTHLQGRAALQVMTAALVFLYLPAEVVFQTVDHGCGWQSWMLWPPAMRDVLLTLGLLLALAGVAAVMDFAQRGEGTPIPYDPPRRLVMSGVYRYVANPMQASCTLVLLLWALALRSPWLLTGPVLCGVYCAGIARWDESADLRERFGEPWVNYRREVRAWWPRLSPYLEGEATLYIARGCAPCSAVRRWVEKRSPADLRMVDAELLPAGSIRRMRYVSADERETVDGVRAMGRALEHLHLGWAIAGAALRLPLVWQVTQALMDVCGFGPRVLVCDVERA